MYSVRHKNANFIFTVGLCLG